MQLFLSKFRLCRQRLSALRMKFSAKKNRAAKSLKKESGAKNAREIKNWPNSFLLRFKVL